MARRTPGEILAYMLQAPTKERPKLQNELAQATYDTLTAGVAPGTEVSVTITAYCLKCGESHTNGMGNNCDNCQE